MGMNCCLADIVASETLQTVKIPAFPSMQNMFKFDQTDA